jgi:hypothetical protein|nr:hypothetical protein [Fusobacterium nucleatum]
MAFLDKIAKQERTGAGIAGVNIDTGIANMISPKNFDGTPIKAIGTMSTYQLEVLDTIEKFAKDVDKARTENAKIRLGLDLENARIDLEEKWASVHDKYTNDDTWNSYLEDKKKLLSEQSKMISSMKYMSMEEKKLAIEKNDIAYREDYAKNLGIRTDAVAKREADNARGNLEQIVTITSNLGIHDDKKAQENYKTMVNQINVLKEFAGLSNEQALVMYGNYVTKAEMGRQENYLEQVVMNEDLTFEQREAKLNELKKVMDNKDLMRDYAKEMTDLFTTDNKEEAEEYLYTKLTDESSKVINRMSNQFKRVKKERQEAERARIRAEKQMQRLYLRNLKIDQALRSEKYSDIKKAFKKKYGRDMTDNDIANGMVNFDWASAGDLDNFDKVEIFDKNKMENLKRNINAQIDNERMSEVEAKNLVRDYAEKLFENDNSSDKELKVNAFIKQYADEDNPIPYVYGKEYPELYQAERVNKNSKGNYTNVNIRIPEKGFIGWFDDEGYDEWNDLRKDFSSDPVYADAQLKNYIIGVMKEDGYKESQINSTTMQPYLKKLNTNEGKRLINASKVLKSGRPTQNAKSNTVSTKKNKMGGYLR